MIPFEAGGLTWTDGAALTRRLNTVFQRLGLWTQQHVALGGDEFVTPGMFGVVPNLANDASDGLNAMLATGMPVVMPAGIYRANNLTQSTTGQVVMGLGQVIVQKNANGTLFTSTGNDVHLHNIGFRGDASGPVYTGDNVVATGNNFHLMNCGSRWAFGRSVKITGSQCHILGTCDIYQTADATSNGYEIELGVSGTATLYHRVHNIMTTQSTGGILCVDTGSVLISGSQFGKLSVQSGAAPAGTNGGNTVGNRITGDVNVALPNAVFAGNAFGGSVDFTFLSGTTNCTLDASNIWANGSTVTNSGNAGNYIARILRDGTETVIRIGDDVNYIDLGYDPTVGFFQAPNVFVGGVQVVGAQQAAIPDSGNATTDAILAAMRAHGLIAT